MKKLLLILFLLFSALSYSQISKVQGTAYLEITTAQRDALIIPAGERMIINNSSTGQLEQWDGTAWTELGSGSGIGDMIESDYATLDSANKRVDTAIVAIKALNIGSIDSTNVQTKDVTSTSETSNYTVNFSDIGDTKILNAGVSTVTLSDDAAEIVIGYQVTFINNSGGAISWAYGTGDADIKGALPDIPDGYPAHAHLIATNLWSVSVGGQSAGGGGVTDHTALTSIGVNSHAVIDAYILNGISVSGTPVNNELIVSMGGGVVHGQANLTYEGTEFNVASNQTITGTLKVQTDPTDDTMVGDVGYNNTLYEGNLSNPGTDGHILSSTIAGVRSWIVAHTDIDTDYGAETVTSNWSFTPYGSGDFAEIDLTIGGANYGMMNIGNASFGRTNRVNANMDLDGSVIILNKAVPSTSNILFAMMDGTNSLRFALPKSGVGNATYNPRSMLIAGPTANDDTVVTVGYWQGQGIFHNLVADTDTDGADLGVQNDLEVEGDLFVDSIKESTTGAGVTVESKLILNTNPTLDSHVGNQGYNDLRYAELADDNTFTGQNTFDARTRFDNGSLYIGDATNYARLDLFGGSGGAPQAQIELLVGNDLEIRVNNGDLLLSDDVVIGGTTQLGGDLYLLGNQIIGTNNGLIDIAANGSGSQFRFEVYDQNAASNDFWLSVYDNGTNSQFEFRFETIDNTTQMGWNLVNDSTDDLGVFELFRMDVLDGNQATTKDFRIETSEVTIATKTVAIADMGTVIYCQSGSATTVSVPDTWALKRGSTFTVVMEGTGQVTIDPTGTTQINGAVTDLLIDGQWGTVQFIHLDDNTDDWHAFGKIQ